MPQYFRSLWILEVDIPLSLHNHNNPFCFEFELEDGKDQHKAPHLSATNSLVYIESRAISD
jgi:hypothetical protein